MQGLLILTSTYSFYPFICVYSFRKYACTTAVGYLSQRTEPPVIDFISAWLVFYSFILQSFSQAISIAPLQHHYYSEALQFYAEAPQAAASEILAQGPYVGLDRDSNPRPSGIHVSTLPMIEHAHIPRRYRNLL